MQCTKLRRNRLSGGALNFLEKLLDGASIVKVFDVMGSTFRAGHAHAAARI